MTIGKFLLLAVVVIAALAVCCGFVVFLEKKFPGEQYDERQKVARGNAYRVSFFVEFAYFLFMIPYLILNVDEEMLIQPYLLAFIGMVLQLLSFHIYCLMTHSALPLSKKPIPAMMCYLVLGGLYLAQYFMLNPEHALVAFTGQESSGALQLIMSVSFFALGFTHLVAYVWKEKEETDG